MANINFNTRTIADPGNGKAIPIAGMCNFVCNMTSAGAGETRTLGDPTVSGQTLGLCVDTDGGAIAITAASGINKAGNTVMTFSHLGDSCFLAAVTQAGALRWQVVGSDDVAFS